MRFGAFVRFGVGLVVWTLAEYLTHRFPMHGRRGTSPLADEHLDHHADPLDARPLRPDVHNLGYKGAGFVLASTLVGPSFACGFTAGYAGYTHVHHEMHRRPPRSSRERRLWRRHHDHHFNGPVRNYGVTCDVWDRLLSTERQVTTPISVPASRAPDWMAADSDYTVAGQSGAPSIDARVVEAPVVEACDI